MVSFCALVDVLTRMSIERFALRPYGVRHGGDSDLDFCLKASIGYFG